MAVSGTDVATPTTSTARDLWLVRAGYLFAAGSGIHLIDHLRRGQDSVTEQLYWAGNMGLVVQVAVITLIITRHRVAPLAAMAAGVPLALGFTAAHWLPTWSSLSDSFVEDGASAFSYVASLAEILGALAIALAGYLVIQSRGIESAASRGATQTIL
jgi:hypothetical protein